MKQFLFLASVFGVLATFTACGDSNPSAPTATANSGLSSITTLQVTDLVVGTGNTATAG